MLKHIIFSICLANLSTFGMDKPRPISVCGNYNHLHISYHNDPTWTELHNAAYTGTDTIDLKNIIEQVLALKGTVDLQDKFGQTPLWWAAHNGKKDAVALLLQYGASVTHADMFKRTVRSKIEANPTLKPLLNTGIKP